MQYHIGVDPTEVREGTRLPQSVIRSATVIEGLEEMTGADLLLSPDPIQIDRVSAGDVASRLALERLSRTGMLVQRKAGGDFLSSLGDLGAIQERMSPWCSPGGCWLLVTDCRIDDDGHASASDRKSGWTLESIRGSILWWRLRGGHVHFLPRDEDIGQWVSDMLGCLRRIQGEPVRSVVQGAALQGLSGEERNWVTTGAAFPPGIGREKRESLAREICPECDPVGSPPPLAQVLLWTTSGRLRQASGWGPTLLGAMREWYGIDETRVIRDVSRFKSISVRFGQLPFEISGDGVEVERDDGGVTVTFTHYTALEQFTMLLAAVRDVRRDQDG